MVAIAAPVGVVSSMAGPRAYTGTAGEQSRGSGRGNGQDSVLRVHGAGSDVDRRADHLGDVEQREGRAGAGDVADGIDGADFVEMDLLDRDPVYFGFRLAEPLKHGDGILFRAVRQARAFDHLEDVRQVPVFRCLLVADVKFRRRDAAPFRLFNFEVRSRAERIEGFEKCGLVGPRIDQGADGHIPRDAGERIEIASGHELSL